MALIPTGINRVKCIAARQTGIIFCKDTQSLCINKHLAIFFIGTGR